MNVTIIPNDPGCKPVKPGCPVPPANGIAGYDDTVTDFITASPDMGVVLRTDAKVAKLHKGDLVQNLVYVDKSMQLQTITGVLTKVLCPDGACPPPPPCHPCAPEMIQPAVLVLDVSTEYDASVFKIPISSIRDFESDEIDPKDVRVWDIDFITDTQVIFYSKFEPQIVRWNGEDVEFTETRGNVENATRYLITVNSMMAENVLTVIGTGGAIVTRSVKGIAPEIHGTFSIDVVLNKVNELIKNYYNVTANDSGVTIPQKELYVNTLTHCHGVKSIDLIDSDGNVVYDYTVDEVMPLSLGMNSFSYQEIAKVSGDALMIQAPVLLYLMREIAANGYQFRVNGFDIDLSVPVDSVWMNQLVASNVLVYDGSDPRNHAKVCNDVANLYKEIVTTSLTEDHVINAKRLKHKSNDLLKETLHQLNVTLITPIDREDIQSIASLLNKITKRIVKASLNLKVYRLENFTENMQKQAQTLYQATEELKIIIHNFKKSSSIKEMTETNLKMKEIESYGDEIHYHAIDELFSGKYDALTVIKLRDIHKDIENALDSCFSVSDAVVNVVLKQS